jgi:hypothetical protein
MVYGAKTANTTGIIQLSNASPNLKGLTSHQTNRAILGPKKMKTVIMQHIKTSNQ